MTTFAKISGVCYWVFIGAIMYGIIYYMVVTAHCIFSRFRSTRNGSTMAAGILVLLGEFSLLALIAIVALAIHGWIWVY